MADCGHPTPISVAPGAADSTVESDTPTNALDCYQVAAEAGQVVSITVAGGRKDPVFAVFAPGWQASCTAVGDCDITGDQLGDDEATTWSDTAPSTGAYLIVIDNSRSDSDYRLSVELR